MHVINDVMNIMLFVKIPLMYYVLMKKSSHVMPGFYNKKLSYVKIFDDRGWTRKGLALRRCKTRPPSHRRCCSP